MPSPPEVSVVIPVLNGARVLPACLDALAAQVDAPPFEVIVVDNGSGDETVAVARAHAVGCQVTTEQRRGSYAARNAGIAVASGRVLAFTDADCIPSPSWLAAGLLVGADLVGGRIDPLVADDPTLWEIYDAATYLDQRAYVERESFAATANLFVRRSVFDAVGPFDPSLRSSGDWEWCRRAVAAGFSIAYADDAVVHHRLRRSFVETWRVHGRLGAGWHILARRGLRDPAWRDQAMRWQLAAVREKATGTRARRLALAHAVALTARWTGRVSRR